MIPTVALSETGPVFSRILIGVMKWGKWGHSLSAQEMLRLIEQCIELGATSFDHADIYGDYTTEAAFGAALKLKPALRDDIQLISKCGIKLPVENRPGHKVKSYDTSRRYIIESVERSLKNLDTGQLDLLLIHRPSPLMDPEEIAEAFGQLDRQGKVLAFGVSNFTPNQFSLLDTAFPMATNQVQASALHLDPFLDGTFTQCLARKIHPMAWSPLGGGALFRKDGGPRAERVKVVLEKLAKKRAAAIGISQIMLAWLMKHPAGILPVVGSARISRLRAAAAATRIELTDEEWFEVWQASTGAEVP